MCTRRTSVKSLCDHIIISSTFQIKSQKQCVPRVTQTKMSTASLGLDSTSPLVAEPFCTLLKWVSYPLLPVTQIFFFFTLSYLFRFIIICTSTIMRSSSYGVIPSCIQNCLLGAQDTLGLGFGKTLRKGKQTNENDSECNHDPGYIQSHFQSSWIVPDTVVQS